MNPEELKIGDLVRVIKDDYIILKGTSLKSGRCNLADAIWGLSQHDMEFDKKFKQLLNETKQRFQKEFDEL